MQLFKVILTTKRGAPVAALNVLGTDEATAEARARVIAFGRTGRTSLKVASITLLRFAVGDRAVVVDALAA